MSRTTVIYLLTIVLSAAGLWAILKVGSGLTAPPDVSGVWQIVPGDPSDPVTASLGGQMRVEQSGRYLQVRFAGGQVLDLKGEAPADAPPGTPPTLRATDGTWTLAFRPQKAARPAGDGPGAGPEQTELLVLVEKPGRHSFVARRGPEERPG